MEYVLAVIEGGTSTRPSGTTVVSLALDDDQFSVEYVEEEQAKSRAEIPFDGRQELWQGFLSWPV